MFKYYIEFSDGYILGSDEYESEIQAKDEAEAAVSVWDQGGYELELAGESKNSTTIVDWYIEEV